MNFILLIVLICILIILFFIVTLKPERSELRKKNFFSVIPTTSCEQQFNTVTQQLQQITEDIAEQKKFLDLYKITGPSYDWIKLENSTILPVSDWRNGRYIVEDSAGSDIGNYIIDKNAVTWNMYLPQGANKENYLIIKLKKKIGQQIRVIFFIKNVGGKDGNLTDTDKLQIFNKKLTTAGAICFGIIFKDLPLNIENFYDYFDFIAFITR